MMKEVIWMGTSKKDLLASSDEARSEVGFELYNVQLGLEPSDYRPMPSIGNGVKEIRIHAESEYRVIYVATFREAIYVLHVFVKKTEKTAWSDIQLARKRYLAIANCRGNS